MTIQVTSATSGVSALDSATKLTNNPAVLAAISEAGYRCVIRYVPLPYNSAIEDIDAAEVSAIMSAGLALMLVQHVRSPGWNPADASGKTDAQQAVNVARAAGYLPGAHLFLDLEGIVGSSEATSTFANDWADFVVASGYAAGVYVGYEVPLNGQQLYDLHKVTSYWSDPDKRTIAVRGYAMLQGSALNIQGVNFDSDAISSDLLGQTPKWMLNTNE